MERVLAHMHGKPEVKSIVNSGIRDRRTSNFKGVNRMLRLKSDDYLSQISQRVIE
jgi:hypothetical protein